MSEDRWEVIECSRDITAAPPVVHGRFGLALEAVTYVKETWPDASVSAVSWDDHGSLEWARPGVLGLICIVPAGLPAGAPEEDT